MNDAPSPPPPTSLPTPGHYITVGRLWRLTRKELRETLRDRRTMITLFLMPLLVYPLLSLAFRQFLFASYQSAGDSTNNWNVGVYRKSDRDQLEPHLIMGDKMLDEYQVPGNMTHRSTRRASLLSQLSWFESDDLQRALLSGDLDVGIEVSHASRATNDTGSSLHCQILYRSDSAIGANLAREIERRLRAVNEHQWQIRLRDLGQNSEPVADVSLKPVNSNRPFSLPVATLVPLILILMTITGAVYPAIDLTAGERERGTLESLMASPVPRFAVLLAKYLAVLTVAVLTALMNVLAMTVTVQSTGLGGILFGGNGFSLGTLLIVFGLLVMFAAFFSAVLLALTSFARSFKEAQAYLIPLMLVAMTPGFLSVVPGVALEGWWAVTPLANMVLLARDVLERGVDPFWAIVAVASTFVYGLTALVLAANIFGNDAILYGSQESWEEWLHRPQKATRQPTVGWAMFTLAMIFPLHVWLTGQLSQWTNLDLSGKLVGGAVITWGLYLFFPLFLARLRRLDFRGTFLLQPFSPIVILGVILLGCSLWPLAHEMVVVSRMLGLSSLSPENFELVRKLAGELRELPFAAIFFSIAITPAICEECFFRGYFFSALRAEAKGWTAIGLSGVIFGLFHVILGSGAQVERLFSTSMLGCVLAWIAWRTGSIFPSMLLHVIHNGLIVGLMFTASEFSKTEVEGLHLPPLWLLGSVVGTIAGVAIVLWGTSNPGDTSSSGTSATDAERDTSLSRDDD